MGENPIALRSKARLVAALLELMGEKAYADITITELCSRAHLSRPAFYQNFDRMDSIFDRHVRLTMAAAVDEAEIRPGIGRRELASKCLAIMDAHEELFQLAIENNLDGNLERQVSLAIKDALLRARVAGKSHDNPEGYTATYLAAAIAAVLVTWQAGKKETSRSQLESILVDLV